MNILVTGGAGFIGSHVAQTLLARGDNVIIVDNLNEYYDVHLKEARLKRLVSFQLGNGNNNNHSNQGKITFIKADISNYAEMEKVFAVNKFDKVCHLAAQAGVRYSLENPFAYEQANCLGTLNILELMRKFNIKDLVFASSSSVYGGNKKIPFSADDNVDNPISLYAATKKSNELYTHVYYHLFGLNCFGLRFFTVYGPWGRPDMALFKFTKAILEDEPIDVYNYGKMKRDFTFITDIVEGVIKALDHVKGYEIFNLGNSKTVELTYFIECIEKELHKTARKNLLPLQQGDVPETFAEIEKTKKILGWEPKVSIEQGVKEFIKWYKEYHKIR